ncbi:MAG: caspase family protein [Pseudomonadota bacterium]
MVLASTAWGDKYQNLSATHGQSWVLVSPSGGPHRGVRWNLLVVGSDAAAASQFTGLFEQSKIRINAANPVTVDQAVATLAARPNETLIVFPGQMLAAPALRPMLQAPQEIYVVGTEVGTYHYGKIFSGKLVANDIGGPVAADERIFVHGGSLLSSRTRIGTVFLDGALNNAALAPLFDREDISYERVVPLLGREAEFAAEVQDKSTPAPVLVTTAQNFATPQMLNALAPLSNLSLRRTGTVVELSSITDDIQSLSFLDVGAKKLTISAELNGTALRVPKLEMKPTPLNTAPSKAEGRRSLADHESGSCEFFANETDARSDRVAFVVGLGAYNPGIPWLDNPANDATAAAELFLDLGFDVYLLTEAEAAVIEDCADRMTAETSAVDVAVLYYSGHGVQIDDKNYLVPVDASRGTAIKEELISFDDLLLRMRRFSRTTLAFLDACRDNPFADGAEEGLAALGTLSDGAGIDASQNGFAIVFATSPNSVASDGEGENSPFTAAFLAEFGRQGVPVQESLARIGARVGEATNWTQTPFTRQSLSQVVFLNGTQTRDEIIAASKSKAQQAEIALRKGDYLTGGQLAFEAFPKGLSVAEAYDEFPEAIRAIEFLYYVNVANFDFDFAGNVAGRIGQNWRHAVFFDYAAMSDVAAVVDLDAGKVVATLPVSKDSAAGIFGGAAIADTRDGQRIATNRGLNEVLIMDFAAQTTQTFSVGPPNAGASRETFISSMEFNAAGDQLFINAGPIGAYLYDVTTAQMLYGFTSIPLPTGEVAINADTPLQLMEDGRVCFWLSRVNRSGRTIPGQWNYQAVGIYDPFARRVDILLWSNEPIISRAFDCAPDGTTALLAGYRVENDFQTGEFALVNMETGETYVSDRLNRAQVALSRDGKRAVFKSSDRLALFDTEKGQFVDFYRFPDINTFIMPNALVTLNGKLDMNNYAEAPTLPPQVFQLDLPFEQVAQRAFAKLPPNVIVEIEKNRLDLRAR